MAAIAMKQPLFEMSIPMILISVHSKGVRKLASAIMGAGSTHAEASFTP